MRLGEGRDLDLQLIRYHAVNRIKLRATIRWGTIDMYDVLGEQRIRGLPVCPVFDIVHRAIARNLTITAIAQTLGSNLKMRLGEKHDKDLSGLRGTALHLIQIRTTVWWVITETGTGMGVRVRRGLPACPVFNIVKRSIASNLTVTSHNADIREQLEHETR